MNEIQGNIQGKLISWFHRNRNRGNSHCLYCGRQVTEDSNKEHVIARNFVPAGSFCENDFNFLFCACRSCNSSKADDERHVSSITLVNSPARAEDSLVDATAVRKANGDYHPDKPGTKIGDSCENRKVLLKQSPQLNVSMGFVSPPQINMDCVKRLALRQVQALFSLVTTSDIRMPTLLPPASFRFFKCYAVDDWGNPQLKELAKRVEPMRSHVNIKTASGFVKALLRRNENSEWFWALEWNKYLRVTGALTQPSTPPPDLFEDLPVLKWGRTACGEYRYREEIPFANDYQLFPD